jgi:NAD(P)-dependent dehydrogenase (short-subunit alcohol dehydrogenase family)
VAGRSGHKLHGPYAASKGGLDQLMRVMAHENAAHGVTANAVVPAYMDTALTSEYLAANLYIDGGRTIVWGEMERRFERRSYMIADGGHSMLGA